MAGSDQVAFKDAELRRRIEAAKADDESIAAAAKRYCEIGMREARYPWLFRLKDSVLTMAGWLTVGAAVVMVVGLFGRDSIDAFFALKVSVTLVGFALLLVALFELARVVTGQSELGWGLREWAGVHLERLGVQAGEER